MSTGQNFLAANAAAWSPAFRACFKIGRGPAARDFGRGQGGEFRASPQRAVRSEPTQATGKRPAARRVFGQKAAWLRCSSLTDRWRVCSLVAPRHPAFCPKTGLLRILKQALRFIPVKHSRFTGRKYARRQSLSIKMSRKIPIPADSETTTDVDNQAGTGATCARALAAP